MNRFDGKKSDYIAPKQNLSTRTIEALLSVGANNVFDVYPDKVADPRLTNDGIVIYRLLPPNSVLMELVMSSILI